MGSQRGRGLSDSASEPQRDDPHASLRPQRREGIESVPRTLSTWTITRASDSVKLRDIKTTTTEGTSFILNDVIGEGGVGEIWSALQVSLDRVVAVKKVRGDRDYLELDPDSPQRRFIDQRFHDEAMITAHLEHPNIVPVYDFGQDIDGTPMLAMKLMRGRPWDQILREDFKELGADAFLAKHLPTFIDMMQAVAFAHSRSIVHRDLKPSQVMIGEFGEVILIDWGLAILTENTAGTLSSDLDPTLPTPVTATSPSGTPALMAPEQTLDTAAKITRRTDIYLLGSTLYYLLTGYYPHDASSTAVSMKLAAKGIVSPPCDRNPHRRIPGDLAALAMEALAPDPADRIASVSEMINRVSDHLTGNSFRRESEKLARSAELRLKRLESAGLSIELKDNSVDVRAIGELSVDSVYSTLNECSNLLDRALGLWFANPSLPQLRDAVSAAIAVTALRAGDLGLARYRIPDIRDHTLRDRLAGIAQRSLQRRNTQARIRRAAVTSVVVLLLLLGVGAAKYNIDHRRSINRVLHERNAAESARRLAEIERAGADVARRHAEREQYYSAIGLAANMLEHGRIESAREQLLHRTPAERRNWEWGQLYLATAFDTITLCTANEDTEFLHATFSPSGAHAYTGDRLGRLSVWDAQTGRLLKTAFPHSAGLWDIVVSPDGQKLLTTSFDKTAAIIDASTLEVVHRLEGHGKILRGGDISPDGRLAVTTSRDRVTRLWDMETGEQLPYQSTGSRAYEAKFLPDGSAFLVAQWQYVNMYDTATGGVIRTAPEHPENILDVCVSPDGTQFVTACTDRIARVFNVGTMELELEISNTTSWLHCVDWSPDGSMIATGDNDGTGRVWDARTGDFIHEVQTRHSLFKVDFSPDSRRLLTAANHSAQIWDLDLLPDDGAVHALHSGKTTDKRIDGSLRVFAAPLEKGSWLGYDRHYRQGSTGKGRSFYDFENKAFTADSYYTAWAPDNSRRIVTDHVSLHTIVVDSKTAQTVKVLSEDDIFHTQWSPDGRHFATGSVNGDIVLWESTSLTALGVLGESYRMPEDIQARIPAAFCFDPTGSKIVVGRRNGLLEIFDVKTRKRLRSLQPDDGAVFAVTFSPDGHFVAAGGLASKVRIWEVQTGDLVSTLIGHKLQIRSIAFHPNGARVLTAGGDDAVKLWETETGREVSTVFSLPGDDFLLGAAFSDDGMHAIAASSEGHLLMTRALPWEDNLLPDIPGFSLEDRIRLVKRRVRTGLDILPEDIALDIPRTPEDALAQSLGQ